MFSRQPLSRLTFLKVVCLQTSLSDLKMLLVFTGKIIGGQTRGVMLKRQKTCVVHTEATCNRGKITTCAHMKMLRVHVSRICCGDMSPRVN